jgi:hypothetical protein
MEPAVTPLDLDAIRSRANAADASWLPRWVPHDVRSLVSEVLHLRGVVKAQSDQDAQRTARHVDAVIAQQRLTVEAREATRALAAENAALRAQVAASTGAVTAWLRADAARTPPGPVSPIRRVEQAYATRVANIIERDEHRREEER